MKQHYVLLILFMFSCSNKKIPATIKVESIKATKGGFHNMERSFNMIISSDIDLVTYYEEKKAVNFYIFCPLASNNFPNRIESEPFKLIGFINKEENILIKENRFYNAFPIFFENNEGKTINDEKIKDLLIDKKCIECKLIMPLYVMGPQAKSEKFCIPAEMILKNFDE